MLFPRYSLKSVLLGVTLFVFCMPIARYAAKGEHWAWAILIAVAGIAVFALVYALLFLLLWATSSTVRSITNAPPLEQAKEEQK